MTYNMHFPINPKNNREENSGLRIIQDPNLNIYNVHLQICLLVLSILNKLYTMYMYLIFGLFFLYFVVIQVKFAVGT